MAASASAAAPLRATSPARSKVRRADNTAAASLTMPSTAGLPRQQAAADEARCEGDEQARHRLLLDLAAERLDGPCALGGEPVVELQRLVAELRGRLPRRALAGTALDVLDQRREVAAQRGKIVLENID